MEDCLQENYIFAINLLNPHFESKAISIIHHNSPLEEAKATLIFLLFIFHHIFSTVNHCSWCFTDISLLNLSQLHEGTN